MPNDVMLPVGFANTDVVRDIQPDRIIVDDCMMRFQSTAPSAMGHSLSINSMCLLHLERRTSTKELVEAARAGNQHNRRPR